VFNLQGSEIIVILLIALVVLGPERLPDAVRRFMQTYNELKKMGGGFQAEIKSAFDEPMREMRNTANMVRDAADPSKLAAEAEAEQRLRDDADSAVAPTLAPPVGADMSSSDGPELEPPAHNGVVDPGYDAVATPGSPPPPPPLPPLPQAQPQPSRALGASAEGFVPTPRPPPPPPPVLPEWTAGASKPAAGLTGSSEPAAP
jgi:sec-independent protein translocase protein TatB